MDQPTRGADKSDARPALLGVACGAGAALFWALGFVATRHGLKVGFTPTDLLMHRFLWSGLVFLPIVLRAGIGNLGGIGWGRGLVLMVLGGPVMSLISYTGFLFVPLGHGSVIQPSSATLGGLLLAAVFLLSRALARQRELNPMELCEPCKGIQRNWRKAPGHAELVQRGNRKEDRETGTVTITRYQCDRCGTAWEYESDKTNQQAGWSVVGR